MAGGNRAVSWPIRLIFALCALPEIFFAGAEAGLWADPEARQRVFDWFAFWPHLPADPALRYPGQEWVMFLTYGFLHGGFAHLAMNMLGLLQLGEPLARLYGNLRFIGIYLALAVAGGLAYAVFPAGDAPMVGASGALFGLAGILMSRELQSRQRRHLPPAPVFKTLGMLVLMNVVLWWALDGQLAWQTHLGGFMAGWVLARALPAR